MRPRAFLELMEGVAPVRAAGPALVSDGPSGNAAGFAQESLDGQQAR